MLTWLACFSLHALCLCFVLLTPPQKVGWKQAPYQYYPVRSFACTEQGTELSVSCNSHLYGQQFCQQLCWGCCRDSEKTFLPWWCWTFRWWQCTEQPSKVKQGGLGRVHKGIRLPEALQVLTEKKRKFNIKNWAWKGERRVVSNFNIDYREVGA